MIQRIQSLFLLLAAVAFGLLFVFPFASSSTKTGSVFADGIFNINDHIILLIFAVVGGLVALVSLFMFKNRPLQIKLGYFIIIISILLSVVAVFFFMNESKTMEEGAVNDQAGLFMPVLALVFGFLGNYFIKKDDKLVKSADRLR